MKYMSHLLKIQNVRILLHEKITGFIQLNLRTMFRHNLPYFASLIIFMDRLYLDNDFRTLYLSFYYFYSCCCCFVVVVVFVVVFVAGFVILLLFSLYLFIMFTFMFCGFVRYYFLKLLGISIIYVSGIWRAFCYFQYL